MSTKFNIKETLGKVTNSIQNVVRYLPIIFIVFLALSYSFLVFRINFLTSSEPSDSQVAEKLQTVQQPKIDQAVLNKIQLLQDNSVEVQTLFQSARDNPFQE